jgi:hypothetical protein
MERLSSLQAAALRGTVKRRREDQAVTGEDPLQNSMKRLRVDGTPSPTFDDLHHRLDSQHLHQGYEPMPILQSRQQHQPHQQQQSQANEEIMDEYHHGRFHRQEAGQDSASKEHSQTYTSVNLLLGNLHQERRRLQQQRDHQTRRRTKPLPSNSQLY